MSGRRCSPFSTDEMRGNFVSLSAICRYRVPNFLFVQREIVAVSRHLHKTLIFTADFCSENGRFKKK